MPILRHITALLVALCFSCGTAYCTDKGLGLTLLNYTLSNSEQQQARQGFTITINAQLTNFDSNQYVGIINFGLRNNTNVLSNDDAIFARPGYSGIPIILNAGESVPAIFNVHVDAAYFKPGPDVVVVWPISTAPVQDSILIKFTVTNGVLAVDDGEKTEVDEEDGYAFSYAVLPNKLMLLNVSPETNFKQVRIYDLTGRLMQEQKSEYITEVPVSTLPKGLYLSEFTSTDGRKKTIKFFH